MGIFNIFKSKSSIEKIKKYKLTSTNKRNNFTNLNELISKSKKVNDELFEEIEDILIQSDLGVDTTLKLVEAIKKDKRIKKCNDAKILKELIVDNVYQNYITNANSSNELNINTEGLKVILIVGVNGVGKTTSIAKLSHMLSSNNNIMLAAADTFRTGAVEQLNQWGKKLNIPVYSKSSGSDPSSVIFEAIQQAKKDNIDLLICDTAGRLQTKQNLMKELEKIKKIISREVPDAPHETLLVIDSTTGQNGLSQSKIFNETTDLSGIILTKLDGTAKGGIALSINDQLGLPIKLIGTGESLDDIDIFNIENFIYSLFIDFFEE